MPLSGVACVSLDGLCSIPELCGKERTGNLEAPRQKTAPRYAEKRKSATTKKAIAAKKSTYKAVPAKKRKYKAGVSGQRSTRYWTPEETKELLDLYEMYGSNWSLIAERMTTKRSALACLRRYDKLAEIIDSIPKRDKKICVKWTPEESEKLIELRNNGTDWETIASSIGRSVPACRKKYGYGQTQRRSVQDSSSSSTKKKK